MPLTKSECERHAHSQRGYEHQQIVKTLVCHCNTCQVCLHLHSHGTVCHTMPDNIYHAAGLEYIGHGIPSM